MPVAEYPTGDLPTLFPLVFNRREVAKDKMLGVGQLVVLPLDLRPVKEFGGWVWWLNKCVGRVEYVVDYTETMIRWEAYEVGLDRESLGVSSSHVFKNV